MRQVPDAVHLRLDRDGDLLLDLLGCASGPLRDDPDVFVGHIGIGFDRQIVKRDDAPDQQAMPSASTSMRFRSAKSTR